MTWMGLSDQNMSQISLLMLIYLFPQLMFGVKWKAAVCISAVALDLVLQVLLIHTFNDCGLPAGIQNGFMINCQRQYLSYSWITFSWKTKKKLDPNIKVEECFVTHAACFLTFNTSTKKCKGKGKVIPLQARCAHSVGTGIPLLFHAHGTRRGWVTNKCIQ